MILFFPSCYGDGIKRKVNDMKFGTINTIGRIKILNTFLTMSLCKGVQQFGNMFKRTNKLLRKGLDENDLETCSKK